MRGPSPWPAGAVLSLDLAAEDFDARFRKAFRRLCDPAVRGRLGRVSRALCDGLGAGRVAEALIRSADR